MNKRPPLFNRKFLVNKKLQSLILLNALCCTIFACVAIIVGQTVIAVDLSTGSVTFLVCFLLLVTALIFGTTFLISHQIAGPVYRLESELNRLYTEEMISKPIAIRANDQFQELIQAYNAAILRKENSEVRVTQD